MTTSLSASKASSIKNSGAHYTAVAVALHWSIAAAILTNLALGWWMHEAIDAAQTQARAIAAYQLHKSLGLTILFLSLARLGWRVLHAPPPLPVQMPAWEKTAARVSHWALYTLMIAVPFSGWLYVSTQWRDDTPLNVPTLWFGLFEVPHLLGLSAMANDMRQAYAEVFEEVHEWLAWSMAALLGLHVAAALKHHFVERDDVLMRMRPFAGTALGASVFALVLWLLLAAPTQRVAPFAITSSPASNWAVDAAKSSVHFSGTHAGVAFRGSFSRWQADIRFDPANLAGSHIGGTFETASAQDGVPLHDESLPQKEWFDVEQHPTASFRSTRITPKIVEGVLTLKGHDLPVALSLNLEGDRMTLSGRFEVDRAEADLGMESDANAQYVSRKIAVDVNIEAARKPTS